MLTESTKRIILGALVPLSEAVQQKNPEGETFIKFKCPGYNNASTSKQQHSVYKRIVSTIDKHTKEFTGVPASKLISPSYKGNYNLYEKQHFKGSDGHTYRIHGVDTENYKGFSIKVTRLDPEKAKDVANKLKEPGAADVPDIKFDKYGNRDRTMNESFYKEHPDGVTWTEDKYRILGDELASHDTSNTKEELRMSHLHYNKHENRYYANLRTNKADHGDYSFKLDNGGHNLHPHDVKEEEYYSKSNLDVHHIGSHDNRDNVTINGEG